MKLSDQSSHLIWHPFTQEKVADLPILIKKGEGVYLYDGENNSYMDLISSWWVNLHGHAQPEIARAIYEQSLKLEHVIFAGFTHDPAIKLCRLIKRYLPGNLSRFFFSDNGSTSVEVALKMAYQYWWNKGEKQRNLFLSFEGGYHGDTLGAMSVGAKSGYHDPFKKFFFKVLSIPYPSAQIEHSDVEHHELRALNQLRLFLKERSNTISALIVEPLVQGAAGMRFCRPEFLEQVINLVRDHKILVIFDEVMTGFGRTGTLFALDHLQSKPDFLCLSKGITGGFLPLALTITTQEIYQAFLGDHFSQAFAHGHSYTANPLACAAAIASFTLLIKPQTQQAIDLIHSAHSEGLAYLNNTCKNVSNTRSLGTIAAFEVEGAYTGNLNLKLKREFLKHGLLLRPLGKTVYLLPPYCITGQEIATAYKKIGDILLQL